MNVEYLIKKLMELHPKQAVMIMDPCENAFMINEEFVFNDCYEEDEDGNEFPVPCVFLKGINEDDD
jgi:hypothetical protein